MLSRDELIRTLREQMQHAAAQPRIERVSSGSALIDNLLPINGFRRGSLVEWLGQPGSGATTMALLAAREAGRCGGALVMVDPRRRFYPPAALALGIDLEKLILIRPANQRDERWALVQALNCRAVAAVLCWPEKLDSRAGRRWQLAAEQGGTLGFLVRPLEMAAGATWSEARLHVAGVPSAGPRRLRIELLRSRSSGAMHTREGRSIEVEVDEGGLVHETRALHLVPRVAHPAPSRRSAGA
jgi:hypothetical protein